MDTEIESLFRSMLLQEWFTQTEGDSEAPTGFFGWTWNTKGEVGSIKEAFEDTINMYGSPTDEEIIGNFFVYINSDGNIFIERYDTKEQAQNMFNAFVVQYGRWLDTDSEDV